MLHRPSRAGLCLALSGAALLFLPHARAEPPAERTVGLSLGQGGPTGAERRKALVIGNAAYLSSPLKNTLNDARAVSASLGELGFEVTLKTDTTLKDLRRTLGTFVDSVEKDDIVFFFYAGHGLEIEGINYLVPVDFNAERAADVAYEAFPLNQFLDGMEARRPSVNVVVLDACRNNPFVSGTRAFGRRGLAEVRAGQGSLIAFATSPGKTASDGDTGANGVFTGALIRHLKRPGVDIEAMFKDVSDDVAVGTGREQVPWRSSSIVGKYYLAGAAGGAPVAASTPPPDPTPAPSSSQPVAASRPLPSPPATLPDSIPNAGGQGEVKVPKKEPTSTRPGWIIPVRILGVVMILVGLPLLWFFGVFGLILIIGGGVAIAVSIIKG
ncbi:MAG: caspase family protein [Myxococcota bacterium]